jgi:hypothetical protein
MFSEFPRIISVHIDCDHESGGRRSLDFVTSPQSNAKIGTKSYDIEKLELRTFTGGEIADSKKYGKGLTTVVFSLSINDPKSTIKMQSNQDYSAIINTTFRENID